MPRGRPGQAPGRPRAARRPRVRAGRAGQRARGPTADPACRRSRRRLRAREEGVGLRDGRRGLSPPGRRRPRHRAVGAAGGAGAAADCLPHGTRPALRRRGRLRKGDQVPARCAPCRRVERRAARLPRRGAAEVAQDRPRPVGVRAAVAGQRGISLRSLPRGGGAAGPRRGLAGGGAAAPGNPRGSGPPAGEGGPGGVLLADGAGRLGRRRVRAGARRVAVARRRAGLAGALQACGGAGGGGTGSGSKGPRATEGRRPGSRAAAGMPRPPRQGRRTAAHAQTTRRRSQARRCPRPGPGPGGRAPARRRRKDRRGGAGPPAGLAGGRHHDVAHPRDAQGGRACRTAPGGVLPRSSRGGSRGPRTRGSAGEVRKARRCDRRAARARGEAPGIGRRTRRTGGDAHIGGRPGRRGRVACGSLPDRAGQPRSAPAARGGSHRAEGLRTVAVGDRQAPAPLRRILRRAGSRVQAAGGAGAAG